MGIVCGDSHLKDTSYEVNGYLSEMQASFGITQFNPEIQPSRFCLTCYQMMKSVDSGSVIRSRKVAVEWGPCFL